MVPQPRSIVDNSKGNSIPKEGYYVYILINPLTNVIFYIGKGSGNRVLHHATKPSNNKKKEAVICDLLLKGLSYDFAIIFTTMNESEAYAVEQKLISHFAHRLTNISGTSNKRTYHRFNDGITKETINKLREDAKKVKADGMRLTDDIYIYKGRLTSTVFYRFNSYGQPIKCH